MRRDEEDSSSLEHKQTRKVPDQTTSELLRELEGDVTNPRIRMPVRRGATYTALVPPPAQIIPGASRDQADDEEATSAFEPVVDTPDVPVRRRESVRWGVILGSLLGIVLLGLGAWASFVKMQEKEAATTAKARPAVAQPSPAHASSDEAPAKQALPDAKQADAAPPPSKEIPPAAEPVPAADKEVEKAAEDHAEEGTDTGSGDAPQGQEIDEAALAKAIKARKISKLDQLLVSRASRKKSSLAKAEAHCEALEVAGIAGWRLPEIGELVSLGGARLVRRYIFWSSTAGDAGGERRLTWNAKRKRIRPMSPTWNGGRTVCVRAQP